MKILSIINYKGGVGKTTLTANLALGLAQRGYRVLAVDLDPQTNLTFSFISPDNWLLNHEQSRTIKTWFEHLLAGNPKPPSFDKLAISTHGIDLVSSHIDLVDIDQQLSAGLYNLKDYSPFAFAGEATLTPEQEFAKRYLRIHSYLLEETRRLAHTYDWILFDCPPNFSVVTQNALLASDYYVVPSKMDYLSTLGINQLRKRQLAASAKYHELSGYKREPMFLGVIPTMVSLYSEQMTTVHRNALREIKGQGIPVFDSFVRDSRSAYGENPLTNGHAITGKDKKITAELQAVLVELLQKVEANHD